MVRNTEEESREKKLFKTLKECVRAKNWQTIPIEFKRFLKYKDKLTIVDGNIYYKNRFLLPEEGKGFELIRKAHQRHSGVKKGFLRLSQYYWWPRAYKELEEYVESCELCSKSDHTCKTKEAPLVPIPIPERAWSLVGMDLTGPFQDKNFRFLLVLVEYKSRFPEIIKLYKSELTDIINALSKISDLSVLLSVCLATTENNLFLNPLLYF